MNREERIIRRITEILPAAPERITPVYSSDCELAVLEGISLLCNLDEFSSEDRLRTDNPECLGWNLACAALADVFACGGRAQLYSHALVPAPDWDEAFLEAFARGVGAALRGCGAGFLGGDWGHGDDWRYTAQVIGRPRDRVIDRRGARAGDSLFLSGRIGLGNLEAALGLYGEGVVFQKMLALFRPRFRLLHREAGLVAQYASAAIDTSDGLASGLLQLADQSQVGFVVDHIPYLGSGRLACRLLGKPPMLLALGGAGEYELLFSVPPTREISLLEAARIEGLELFRIGTVVEASQASRILADHRLSLCLSQGIPSARDYQNLSDYLRDLESMVRKGRR